MAGQKTEGEQQVEGFEFFLETEHLLSSLWAIRPSEFVGTRRKVALRIEAYAWAPVLRSFDKLREVGD